MGRGRRSIAPSGHRDSSCWPPLPSSRGTDGWGSSRTGHTGLSALASSHTVTVSLAVVLALAGHALTHQRSVAATLAVRGGRHVRRCDRHGGIGHTRGAGGRLPAYTLGVAYLLLAAGALSAATMSGRARQGGVATSRRPVRPMWSPTSTPSGPWVPPTSTPSAWGRRNARAASDRLGAEEARRRTASNSAWE